jgi:hypothetical protein
MFPGLSYYAAALTGVIVAIFAILSTFCVDLVFAFRASGLTRVYLFVHAGYCAFVAVLFVIALKLFFTSGWPKLVIFMKEQFSSNCGATTVVILLLGTADMFFSYEQPNIASPWSIATMPINIFSLYTWFLLRIATANAIQPDDHVSLYE